MSEAAATIAYHEAGHAVIARALGLEVVAVMMTPHDLDHSGTAEREWATYPFADVPAAIEKDIKVALAGPHAECQFRSLHFNVMLEEAVGGSSDLKTAKALVKAAVALKHDGLIPLCMEEECAELFDQLCTETEMVVDRNWPAIERVALGLLESSALNGASIDDLIAGDEGRADSASPRNASLQAPTGRRGGV